MEDQTITEPVAQETAGASVNGIPIDEQGRAIPNAVAQPEEAAEEAESHTEESDSDNDSGEVDNKNEETSQPE